jgi:hypothetical protein
MSLRGAAALREAAKRFSPTLLKTPVPPENRLGDERLFRTLEGLMPQQLAVRAAALNPTDPKRRIALCLPRRSGKSYLAAPWFAEEGMKSSRYDRVDFFVAPTLDHAFRLLEGHLRDLKRRTGLPFEIKNNPAGVYFPSGAKLLFRGAKDIDDLGSLVGHPTGMAWIDECQDIRDEVLRHVDNKIGPALRDIGGRLIFSGTPGPICAGLWWEAATGRLPHWFTGVKWTLFDNPHLPPEARSLEAILRETGYTIDTPAFRREYLAEWVEDTTLLVYAYSRTRNGEYQFGDPLPDGHEWNFVIGVDFGYSPDPSACITWAWSRTHPQVFCVAEFCESRLTYTDLYERGVQPMYDTFGPCVVVGDAANPQAIAEINKRWSIGMMPGIKGSKKLTKPGLIEIMNADFYRGMLQIPAESKYAKELTELVWDPDKLPDRKEHPKRANHCSDAGLYAYLQARHYKQEYREPPAPLLDPDQQSGWELAQYVRRAAAEPTATWADDAAFRPSPKPFDMGEG